LDDPKEVDKFIEAYNLLRLNQEEIGNLAKENPVVEAEQDGRGVGHLDFVWSQGFSWIGIKPF